MAIFGVQQILPDFAIYDAKEDETTAWRNSERGKRLTKGDKQ
jgi:hypothetical protein